MAQHVQPRFQLDLSQLPSDGIGQRPGGANYIQLADKRMLDLLTNLFNKTPTSVLHWGIEFEFVGSLPTGFSDWTHPTIGKGTPVNEVFSHPRNIKYRSCPDFMRHVEEILAANEATIRGQIQAYQPNNTQNNTCLLAGPSNSPLRCRC